MWPAQYQQQPEELQNWQLIRIVHVLGDRRDHFETSGDVWELFRIIVAERQRREIEPTLQVLKECIDSPDFQQESPLAQERIRNTWQFMDTLTTWTREMLRLSTATLSRVLKMGASIRSCWDGISKHPARLGSAPPPCPRIFATIFLF